MADEASNPLLRPLPSGIVPQDEVDRTEDRWLIIMLGMLVVMMVVIVVAGITHALHPPSNVEPIDPVTLHMQGEFVESNLGTALELDGVTVRLIAQQFSFVPNCVKVPAGTPVKFRITSADVIHGFILGDTNVNTMVVPGFVSDPSWPAPLPRSALVRRSRVGSSAREVPRGPWPKPSRRTIWT